MRSLILVVYNNWTPVLKLDRVRDILSLSRQQMEVYNAITEAHKTRLVYLQKWKYQLSAKVKTHVIGSTGFAQ